MGTLMKTNEVPNGRYVAARNPTEDQVKEMFRPDNTQKLLGGSRCTA